MTAAKQKQNSQTWHGHTMDNVLCLEGPSHTQEVQVTGGNTFYMIATHQLIAR